MPNWNRFIPADFEYDFENDELAAHHINLVLPFLTGSIKTLATDFTNSHGLVKKNREIRVNPWQRIFFPAEIPPKTGELLISMKQWNVSFQILRSGEIKNIKTDFNCLAKLLVEDN